VIWTVPRETHAVLRRGDVSVVVWALQRQCQRLIGEPATADGDFGRLTEAAVVRLQQRLNVLDDGICGFVTQRSLAAHFGLLAEGVPRRLMLSLMDYEASCLLGAVNWHSAGGVDCGVTQRRVLTAQLGDSLIVQRAFDAAYQIKLAAGTVRERFELYADRPGTKTSEETAWRAAVLYHNYPALAEKISLGGVVGLSAYYTSPQLWTQIVPVYKNGELVGMTWLKFPDGTFVKTPLQWGQRYSLGAPAHNEPGQAVKLVTSWTP